MANPLIVCVGVDLTDQSPLALRQALHLLHGRGGEIHAISVVPHEEESLADVGKVAKEIDAAMLALHARIEELVRTVPHAPHVRLHVRVGHPATVIHQVAVDYDADVIVTGSHSRTGVEKWILGSVAEELVAMARCPVFVVKDRDFDGLPRTPRIEPGAMPKESPELHRSQVVNNSVRPIDRTSHISGLL